MFSSWELIVVLLVALLLFGSRLPQVARSIGRSINSLKKGLSEVDFDTDSKDEDKQLSQAPSNQESDKGDYPADTSNKDSAG